MINPFNPGFGNISPSCIKRPAMQQKLLDQADQLQQGFRSIFIDGPRGCGKTVFLNDLGDAMLDRDGWITVDLELHDDFLSTLVGAIYYQASAAITKAHCVIEPEVLPNIAAATGGYAYAFQILGSLLWGSGVKKINPAAFEKIMPDYQQQLFSNAYLPIVDELTTGDREVIEILAHEISSVVDEGFLKEQIDDTSTAAPVCLQHLIENQIVSLPQPGQVAFTLPYFREFAIKNEARIA